MEKQTKKGNYKIIQVNAVLFYDPFIVFLEADVLQCDTIQVIFISLFVTPHRGRAESCSYHQHFSSSTVLQTYNIPAARQTVTLSRNTSAFLD